MGYLAQARSAPLPGAPTGTQPGSDLLGTMVPRRIGIAPYQTGFAALGRLDSGSNSWPI